VADLDAAAERFARDTEHHEMTVAHDDGLYRHLRFRRAVVLRYLAECRQCEPVLPVPFEDEEERGKWQAEHQAATGHEVRLRLSSIPPPAPGKRSTTSAYWFDLITWPGALTVNGDCGTFTLGRTDDMFGFFRGSQISPGYWAEKVQAADRAGVTAYSPGKFRQLAEEDAAREAGDWPGLPGAVAARIFGRAAVWNTEYEEGAREALENFEHGTTFTVSCPGCGTLAEGLDEDEAYRQANRHLAGQHGSPGHVALPNRVDGFRFTDSWEWNLHDWTWHFLWCCHAIQWGIGQYDARRQAAGQVLAGQGQRP
jgi:hypothetical protein